MWVTFDHINQESYLPPYSQIFSSVKQEDDASTSCGAKKRKVCSPEKKYVLIHCTGYLKSWPLTKVGLGQPGEAEDSAMSCLVAVGRLQTSYQDSLADCAGLEFFSRHGTEGNFTFVDQRVSFLLGYLTQVLLYYSLLFTYLYCIRN